MKRAGNAAETKRSAVKKAPIKDLSVGTKSGGVKGGRLGWTTK